jgi:hypothetical protein
VDEKDRAGRFRMNNPEIVSHFPLIERGLTKRDCFTLIEDAGIELPAMYHLGYHNANCIGCVKGGKGYWNKIRRDFPEVFERMAALEEEIGASCINGSPLRTLDPNAGTHRDLKLPDCGLFCGENAAALVGKDDFRDHLRVGPPISLEPNPNVAVRVTAKKEQR